MRVTVITLLKFYSLFLTCQFGVEKDDVLNWALGDHSRYCTLGDGTNFFEQLGHTPHLQPVCHFVAFCIAGSGKRSVSNCIPAGAFGQYGRLAKHMDVQIDGLVNQTELSEETAWANVGQFRHYGAACSSKLDWLVSEHNIYPIRRLKKGWLSGLAVFLAQTVSCFDSLYTK